MKHGRFFTRRGFTLIELLVVMGIFLVITGTVLANHSKFNSSVLLGSLAYNIALSVREAQVYGLSVQTYHANFQVGYGIDLSAANPNQYVLFADVNADKRYEPGTDSVIQTYAVGGGHTIQKFCGSNASGATQCSTDSTPIDRLDIVFFRPNPDAYISSANPGYYSSAAITVASGSGESRTVTVYSTGQISVATP